MTDKLRHPALTQIKTERDDVYAFEIDGHVTKEEVDEVYQILEQAYEKHEKVNLFVRMGRYDGFDWSALFSDVTYAGKLHAIRHMRRYALVGGPDWIANMIRFFNPLFRMEVQHFELEDEADAWKWIYGNADSDSEAT
ncbi:MAG: STAS/SEC14 domain-containing protein [Hyphomicrobiales bacterium]|nr:STAS/SEC14 domain-containing protein [Hyphomicrobiales bacterium]MCP4999500.1 STAS/SEC14 domain-containing protein [Hyphomicrobiales bacterium]